jgi:hypothetical protein
VDGPRVPLLEGLGRQALGEHMVAKRDLQSFQGLPHLSFPSGAVRADHLVLPRDERQQGLLSPSPPCGGDGCLCHITSDPFPPEVHKRRQGRQLFSDFLESVVGRRELRASRSHFKGVDCRVQPAFDLGGRLGSRVRDAKGMKHQRKGGEVVPIRVVCRLPLLHLGLPRLNIRFGLSGDRSAPRPLLPPFQPLLGALQLLASVAEWGGNGERRALDNRMHEVKAIRDAQTLQTLFGKLNQGRGSITHQGQDA